MRRASSRSGRARRRIGASVLIILLMIGGWAWWLEPSSLRNDAYTLAVEKWPSACSGLRIAVLADLHVGSPHNGLDNLRRVVTLTNAAAPDLVLLAGDYVIDDVLGGTLVPPEPIADELRGLQARLGVYAVLGNHDWWYDGVRVQRALRGAGFTVLHDHAERVEDGHCTFWIAGISDFWTQPHDIKRALEAVEPDGAVLALTHNPDVFVDVPASVALLVAGHTHGGQVYLPLIGRPIVPSQYGSRYAIGHIVENGRHLFVSPGIGTSIFPVRFLVPPEVSLLTVLSVPSFVAR